MNLMQLIASVPGIGPYLPYLPLLVAVCACLAPALPPPAAGGNLAYTVLYTLVNKVAMNYGHASNANAPAGPQPAG